MNYVVLQNNDGTAIKILSDKRAAILLIKGVAEPDPTYGVANTFRNVDKSFVIEVTKVIRLIKYYGNIYKARIKWTKRAVLNRDKHTCQYCGSHNANTIDHIVPRMLGGGNTFENTVACCQGCNIKKGDSTLQSLGWKLLSKPKEPSVARILKEKASRLLES